MAYLLDAWYVAAWSHEVGRSLLERVICERPILLFRQQNGEAVGMSNMCPHRFAPLNMGKLIGDTVQCGYHGLRFAVDGKCVLNPDGHGIIPPKMKVRAYPLVERYDMLWIWLGALDRADPAAIPDFSCNTADGFRRIGGMFEVKANYEIITDNLLDSTHAEFVHEGVLSSDAITMSALKTIQSESTIWANRWCPNGAPPPAWKAAFDNYDKPVDLWTYMRWDPPAHMLLDVGVAPVGASRADGIWLYGTDVLTPRDPCTTYYFWSFARNYRIDDRSVDEFWEKSIKVAFEQQDKGIVEAQQRMMGERSFDELGPVVIAADAPAVRARRTLRKLIENENIGSVRRSAAESPLELLRRRHHSRAPIESAV